jgi:hypothetical protein
MSKPEDFPPLDEAVVKKLDALFPERCADAEWTDRKVWIESGKRQVVRFLLAEFKRQNERTPDVSSQQRPAER